MSYHPLHARLQHYDPAFLDPLLLRGDRTEVLKEEAEQIYAFRLFTPEFCRLLIEEAELAGQWRTEADVEDNPYTDIKEYSLPDTTVHLEKLGALDAVYREIVERHLRPLIEATWRTFRMQKVSAPYVLRYSPDRIASMDLHHDLETVTLVVYLNDAFEGGGTRFPRWNYCTGKRAPGSAIVYPGGLSHEHEGLAITSGLRYLMCGSFY
jgi:hypothetical protein